MYFYHIKPLKINFMKKTIILFLTFVFFAFIGFSQNNKDTSDKQVKKIEKTIIISSDDEGDENIMIDGDGPMCCKKMFHEKCGNSCNKHMKFMKNENCKMKSQKHLSLAKKGLVLMPVILFLFFFLIFLFWLRKENYKLSDALSSKSPEVLKTTHSRPDPVDPAKTITEIKEDIYYPRSTSKLIAFFTGLAGIVVVICGLSFHIYIMLSGIGNGCNSHHHCGGLIAIVLVLFAGMLPYIFRTMFKK